MNGVSRLGKKKSGAEKYGGADINEWFDSSYLNKPSFDKGSHKLRSIYHAPQHERHWRKSGESGEK